MNKKVYIILIVIELFFSGCSKTNRIALDYANSKENNQDILTTKSKNSTETTSIPETESSTETTTESNYIKYEKEKAGYYNEFLKRGYKIISQKIEDIDAKIQKNIILNYPKITGFENKNIENKANEVIKNTVLEKYNYYKEINYFDKTDWDINYEIVYINKDILSIMFKGYIYSPDNAHGTDTIFTVNINLNTGDKIYINDLFNNNFKEKMVHKFVKGINIDIPKSMDLETQKAINQEYSLYIDDFDNSYNNFTFGYGKLIMIMYAGNNNYIFYIEYDDLKDCMKENNQLWQGLLKD